MNELLKNNMMLLKNFFVKQKKNENDYEEGESIQMEIQNNISDNIIESDQTIKIK